MSEEISEDVERWTSKRKAALVLSILKGETSVQEAARKHGLTVAEIEDWRERLLLAAKTLCARG
jgi:transposase-like protein